MRPLRLEMRAFGPFAREQVVDFRLLGDARLFLVHGPTGSGKTTVLDAMCFALYGQTSGEDRGPGDVRSHHADPAVSTEVTFDFAIGEDAYRIRRSPAQDRPKKRGGGTTRSPSRAEMWRLDGEDEGEVLATKWGEVTEASTRIVGFEVDQFRRVVVLPQGMFRRFLTAGSGERQEILRILFGTDLYRRIESALKASSKDLQDALEHERQRRDLVLQQARRFQVEDEPSLKEYARHLESDISMWEGRIEGIREREREALGDVQRAHRMNEKLDALDEASGDLSRLEARRDEVEALRIDLGRARAAQGLSASLDILESRRRDLERARTRADGTSRALAEAVRTREEASLALDAQLAREDERREASRRAHDLGALVSDRDALDEARAALAEAVARCESASLDLGSSEQAAREIDENLAAAREYREHTRETAVMLGSARIDREAAEKAWQRCLELKSIERDLEETRGRVANEQAYVDGIRETLEESRARLARIEQCWTTGQAAVLASRLEPGRPCPVCGSTDHPAPATGVAGSVSDADLEDARRQVADLDADLDSRRAVLEAALRDRDGLESRRATLREDLDEDADPASLETRVEKARERERQCEVAVATEEETVLEIADLERKQEEVGRRRDAARGRHEETAREEEFARARVQEGEGRLPGELRAPGMLEGAIEDASRRMEILEEDLGAARRAMESASETHAGAVSAARAAREGLQEATQRSEKAEEVFSSALADAGFADEQSVRDSLRDPTRIQSMASRIESWDASVQAARERRARALEEAEGLERADAGPLEIVHDEIKLELEQAIEEQAQRRERYATATGWIDALDDAAASLLELGERWNVLGTMSRVAAGDNPHRLTLERFVLASLLDDVLAAASRRLRVMSRSRYDLQRVRDPEDRRRVGGLDLEVHDHHTGVSRSVRTLSGGEGFLASLALALGLSDVVQSWSGGVRIDTIFVDEGFGSLDPEALDLAFDTLVDLQAGGRLVGVVSHVPELRERIDVRLEVRPGSDGSTARFVLA